MPKTAEAAATKAGLLDYTQAAAYFGTSERHVRGLWEQRKIPAVKVGRFVRFRVEDLERFAAANLVEAVR